MLDEAVVLRVKGGLGAVGEVGGIAFLAAIKDVVRMKARELVGAVVAFFCHAVAGGRQDVLQVGVPRAHR